MRNPGSTTVPGGSNPPGLTPQEKTRLLLVACVAAGTVLLAVIIVAGLRAVTVTAPPLPPAPAACHNPDLPSGDEEMLAGGAKLVCTDGTWHRP